eukprot:4044333-Pyramimonas_sp.AAC.1
MALPAARPRKHSGRAAVLARPGQRRNDTRKRCQRAPRRASRAAAGPNDMRFAASPKRGAATHAERRSYARRAATPLARRCP